MQQKIVKHNNLIGFAPVRRRSLVSRILQKSLDILQHILLLMAFLMFFSFVQVATATETITGFGEYSEGGLLLLESEMNRMRHAPIVESDIEMRIDELLSHTMMTQVFWNPSAQRVDGKYSFTLPVDADINSIKVVVGGQQIHELPIINRETNKPYKKTSDQKNLFTTEIRNIGPHEQIKLTVHFQQPVKYQQGVYSVRIPLTNSFDQTHSLVDNRLPVSLHIELDAGGPLVEIDSVNHDIIKLSHGAGRYSIRLKENAVIKHGDFELIWIPEPGYMPAKDFNSDIFFEGQSIRSSVPANTDLRLELMIGLLSASLAMLIRIMLLRFYQPQRVLKPGIAG